MTYNLSTLENGLRVLTIPMAGVESVTVLVLVGVGSRYEEKKLSGISHFLEHMAFKGTRRRPTALAIASIIDGIGAEFNAFTSKDHTGYYIKAAKKHLALLLDVLSDMLLHSKFDEKEIEKERRVIIEEINMYEDTPMRKVGDIYENLLYGDTPLGRDISGIKEVIKSVKRQDFLSYINGYYGPGNTIITISGGVDGNPETSLASSTQSLITPLMQLVEKYVGKWKKKEIQKPIPAIDEQIKQATLLRYKDTKQAHLSIGVRSYKFTHPDRFGLAVLSNIMGGGMSSRLFIEVREKRGLAYYVKSSNEMYADVGNFVTQAGVDVERIDDAIAVILSQFQLISQNPVKDEELTRAKENLKGKLTLELEDSRSVAALFATSELLEGKVQTPEEIMAHIDAVTILDVQRIAKDIFLEAHLNLAVIGPYKDEGRFRKLLAF